MPCRRGVPSFWVRATPTQSVRVRSITSLLAQGNEEILETLCRDVVHMSEDEVAIITESGAWPYRLASCRSVFYWR